MSEATSSQAQQSEFWKKLVDEQMVRSTALFDEVGKLESKGAEQVRTAVDEASKIAQETLAYSTKLTAEWRRLSLDAFRNAASLWMPKA